MKNYNIKRIILNEKGITLAALVLTVAIMLIIAGISVNIGTESIDKTRLQGFYTKLEVIQKRVDDIAATNEKYIINNENGTKTEIYLKTAGGSAITQEQGVFLQGILNEEGITKPVSEFRYFTVTDLEEQLDLSEIEYNVFVHFDTRTIIAENGITIDGETYYILKNDMYFVEQNTQKNEGEISSLNYNIINYGAEKYKITVTPSNTIGDLNATGTLRYKKTTTKYWEISTNLEMIISELTQYNIEYKDNNNNTVTQVIEVSLNESDTPIVTVVTE